MANVFVRDYEFDFILIKKLLLLNFLEAVTRRFFVKKNVLRNFAKFTGKRKRLCQSLFLINLQAAACNFVIKETLTLLFPVNFAKFQRTSFYGTYPVAVSEFQVISLKYPFSRNYH